MNKDLNTLGLKDAHAREHSNETREVCSHNEMVANDDPKHAWKCADCGYVYGSTNDRIADKLMKFCELMSKAVRHV